MTYGRFLNMPRGQTWRIPPTPEPWQHRAACAGDPSQSWFTNPNQMPAPERDRLAHTCRSCPVIRQCFVGAVTEGAVQVNRAGCWWRCNSSSAHGRPAVEPWTELWLSEQRLPSQLWRTIPEEDE